MFRALIPAGRSKPKFAWSRNFMKEAEIPPCVCSKCKSSLKKGKIPPRAHMNIPIYDDQRILPKFSCLGRLEKRMLAPIVPLGSLYVHHVGGNKLSYPRLTKNMITFKAATSKVIKALPRMPNECNLAILQTRSGKFIVRIVNAISHSYLTVPIYTLRCNRSFYW